MLNITEIYKKIITKHLESILESLTLLPIEARVEGVETLIELFREYLFKLFKLEKELLYPPIILGEQEIYSPTDAIEANLKEEHYIYRNEIFYIKKSISHLIDTEDGVLKYKSNE